MERRLAKIYLDNGVQLNGSPFVVKTYQLLHDPANHDCVHYTPAGDSFVVTNTHLFATRLPKYFKHCNFASFVRQLNTYGFRKLGSSDWEFRHELFRRDDPDLLTEIRHRGRSKRDRDDEEADLASCPPTPQPLGRFGVPPTGPAAAAAAVAAATFPVFAAPPPPLFVQHPPAAARSSLVDIRMSSVEPGLSRRFDSEAIRMRDAEIRRLTDANSVLQSENQRLVQICEAQNRINRLLISELSRCPSDSDHATTIQQMMPVPLAPVKQEPISPPRQPEHAPVVVSLAASSSGCSDAQPHGAHVAPTSASSAVSASSASSPSSPASSSTGLSPALMSSTSSAAAASAGFVTAPLSAFDELCLSPPSSASAMHVAPSAECELTDFNASVRSKRQRLTTSYGDAAFSDPWSTVDDFNARLEQELRCDGRPVEYSTLEQAHTSGAVAHQRPPAAHQRHPQQSHQQPGWNAAVPGSLSEEMFRSWLVRLGAVYHNPLV